MPSSICKTNKLYYLYTITLTQTQIKMGDITEELLQALWEKAKPVYTPNFQVVLLEDDFDTLLTEIEYICESYIKEITQIKIGDITEELLQALWDNVKTVYTPNCQEVLPEDEFDYFIIKIEAICDNYIEEKL